MTRTLRTTLAREGSRDFGSSSGGDLDREKIEQVLCTECNPDGTGGELPWRTDFGAPLHLLRHRGAVHVLVALARTWAAAALRRWAPRVPISSVDASAAQTELRLDVRHRSSSSEVDETTRVRSPR